MPLRLGITTQSPKRMTAPVPDQRTDAGDDPVTFATSRAGPNRSRLAGLVASTIAAIAFAIVVQAGDAAPRFAAPSVTSTEVPREPSHASAATSISSPDSTEAAAYFARVVAICSAANTRFQAESAALGLDEGAEDLTAQWAGRYELAYDISQETLARLATLHIPDGGASYVGHIFALMRAQVGIVNQLAIAASADDLALFQQLESERIHVAREKDETAGDAFAACPLDLGA